MHYLMAITKRTIILIICVLISLASDSLAQNCSNYTFPSNQVFSSCSDLPVLDAHLHWNYIPSTKRIQIAYRAAQNSTGWIAWAINPTGLTMVGSQALVAFRNSNGSMTAYTTQVTSYNPSMQPQALSFPVSNISATYTNNEMTIFAVVGPFGNGTTFNHVWQAGNSISDDIPQSHPMAGPNTQSIGKLSFL
ncbi:hypothetical protein SLEP1_g28790 [Rubroshorea leprosula]|uniref:DOMON domain-containing protein n=1 Tax=Rubroshorea leprosula TaxID=152421 RepID=A0AAV5JUS0_9ROSI|nr:hypothetical protein SLEP1_g28790 [Rubroshorea leprosula]